MDDASPLCRRARAVQARPHPSSRRSGSRRSSRSTIPRADPQIGGVRMASDVSVEECFRLARAMTWKNAAAGLSAGGGKSVIFGDPRMPIAHRRRKSSAHLPMRSPDISPITFRSRHGNRRLCHGLDQGRDRARCRPSQRLVGGIPLDEIGATGFGLAACDRVAERASSVWS